MAMLQNFKPDSRQIRITDNKLPLVFSENRDKIGLQSRDMKNHKYLQVERVSYVQL